MGKTKPENNIGVEMSPIVPTLGKDRLLTTEEALTLMEQRRNLANFTINIHMKHNPRQPPEPKNLKVDNWNLFYGQW